MFCKLPPNDDRREQIIATGMGHREARFYAELAPSIAMRVPEAHVARTDDAGMFALLLEDLVTTGCEVSDGTWGIPVDSVAGAIEDLAALHVRFDDPARRAAEAPWVRVSRPTNDYAAGMLRYGIDHHRDRLTDSFVEIAELYIDHHDELQRLWHEGPHTVIHGDTHIGNLFLDDGRVGFLDWGIINVNTPMRDISYLMTMAMSIDDRRANERDLLRLYLDLRLAAGVTEISVRRRMARAPHPRRVQRARVVPGRAVPRGHLGTATRLRRRVPRPRAGVARRSRRPGRAPRGGWPLTRRGQRCLARNLRTSTPISASSGAPKNPPCGIASRTWSSASTSAARSARCMRTVLERNRSRVPACRNVGGNPLSRRTAATGTGRARSWSPAYSAIDSVSRSSRT